MEEPCKGLWKTTSPLACRNCAVSDPTALAALSEMAEADAIGRVVPLVLAATAAIYISVVAACAYITA